jgi:transcription termination factor NusB
LLKELSEKSDIKDPKKAEDFSRGKLILLFSVFATQRNYHSDVNTKKALNKLVEIIHQFSGENKYTEMNFLEDLYYLLPNSDLKVDLLINILNIISTDVGLFRSNKSRLEEIINNFNNFDYGKENIVKIYVELSKVLETNKSFEFLNNDNIKINKFISDNFSEASKRPELLKIYFYNTDLNTFKTGLSSLAQESKFVDAILKNNLQGVKDLDISYFNNTYGSGKK